MAYRQIRYFVEKPGAKRQAGPRFYWQPAASLQAAGWHTVRLPNDRPSAELEADRLNASLDRARGSAAPQTPVHPAAVNSVLDVTRRYKASEHFKRLRASTQRVYRQALAHVDEHLGDAPARSLTPKIVSMFYQRQRRVHGLAVGNGDVRVLRLVLEFARLEGVIEINPAIRPKIQNLAISGRLWSPEVCIAMIAAADRIGRSSVGTAIVLNEWIGQRLGDVLQMPRKLTRAGGIPVRQSKTDAGVDLPIEVVPHLVTRFQAELARLEERANKATAIIVNEDTGRPYTLGQFRHAYDAVRAAAVAGDRANGIEPCAEAAAVVIMHLRHTAVTRLAEAGCTTLEIAAITGHSLAHVEAILKHYGIRTRKLAVNAFLRRAESERT